MTVEISVSLALIGRCIDGVFPQPIAHASQGLDAVSTEGTVNLLS